MDYANIILEMLDRIKKLEKEVADLKNQQTGNLSASEMPFAKSESRVTSKRDTTRYLFKGNIYLKNRLVLAVVQDYVKHNPNITRKELKNTFSKSIQGSLGVVELVEVANERKDCRIRYFTKDDEVIRLCDGDVYVCSQWGVLNIPNFVKFAEQLGYNIESIK